MQAKYARMHQKEEDFQDLMGYTQASTNSATRGGFLQTYRGTLYPVSKTKNGNLSDIPKRLAKWREICIHGAEG